MEQRKRSWLTPGAGWFDTVGSVAPGWTLARVLRPTMQALIMRHGRHQGTRQMIELLSLGTARGWDRLRTTVEQALSLGCHDVAAIRHLLVAEQLTRLPIEAMELGALSRYERPQPVISGYDQLLSEVQA